MALISVIMPAYKVDQYLDQCLQSVIDQDLEDIEIIAIDNGSPDKCGSIIKKFASLDKRVKPIFIKENVGYASAVNVGLKIATGKYIAIVDTDDYVEPDMLSTLYNAAEKYGAKIAKGGFTKHFPDGSDLYCRPCCPFYKQEVIVEPLCYNDILYMECSIWSAIYDREFLLENKIEMPEFPGSESQDVVFKFMTYAAVDFLVCIDKSVYNYRVFSANAASKSTQNWDRHFKNYDVIKQWLIDRGFYKSYEHAYYMCMVTDFVFHYRRLSGNLQNLFCEKAKDVCREALEKGVDIFHPRFFDKQLEHYYWADVIPLLEKITHNEKGQKRVLQNTENKQDFKALVKKALKRINKIKIFNKMFNSVILILQKPFFFNKIVANRLAPAPSPTPLLYNINTNSYHIELDYSTNSKKILVILPWYSKDNAVNRNINILADMFKKLGYETHLLVYGHSFSSNISDQAMWDKVFWKQAENWYFGLSDATQNAVDCNRVDDWIAGDFLEAVIRLNNHFRYNICMANYLFFTSAFNVLPDSVKKILYTHDKFANRNSALQEAGFQAKNFWFSVASEREEACALKRADIILAIQEEEGEYFRRITKNKNVMVVPFVPDADFIEDKGLQGKEKIEVGYIASANPPNITAIENVIKMIKKEGKIRIHIAGSVTYALNESDFTENILNEGFVDSLKDFYEKCDVIINPDMFYSGLKVKTAEAMSFGAAIVCTKVASTCLPLDKKHHQLKSEAECVDFLEWLAGIDYGSRLAHINEMRADSREKYTMYKSKYPLRDLIEKICE